MTTTMTELRSKLGALCARAANTRRPIRIRRRGGGEVILVSAEEFDRLAETAHLLSSPNNAARLLAALAEARRGEGEIMSVEALREALGL